MIKLIQQRGDWKCYAAQQLEVVDVQELLASLHQLAKTLKDDKRSLVKQGELFDRKVIAKQPRDKNRRLWSRALSFVRHGEALQSMKTFQRFAQYGIPSVRPLLVLEKRVFGCLVDSWLVYEFRQGSPCGRDQLPAIIGLLVSIHQAGLRHDDPTFGNFLENTDKQVFLIDCKGRRRVGQLTNYIDYLMLAQRNQGVTLADVEQHVLLEKRSMAFRAAAFYLKVKHQRTLLKNRIRHKQ